MRLYERFRGRSEPEARDSALSWETVQSYFLFDGMNYPVTTWGGKKYDPRTETPADDFGGYSGQYKSNGIISTLLSIRLALFSQAWPMWQRLEQGRPGDLWSDRSIEPLRTPWPNGTAQELLARMIQDVDLCGNSFTVRDGSSLIRLRPDWVDVLLDGEEPYWQVVAYRYRPQGTQDERQWEWWGAEEVAHWCPLPDPTASFRGMSWLTPVVREILADSKMTTHKAKFLDNAATPNMVVKYDPAVKFEQWQKFKESIDRDHGGYQNAWKTLHLGAGADATIVGANFQQLDFKVVQGAGETRLAAAAGIPAVVAGFSEGMQGSSLNAGNYAQARRRLADGTLHPLWGSAFGALQTIVRPPSGSRLWHDPLQIPFLREDVMDLAKIQTEQAQQMRTLVDGGFDPESVKTAVMAGDLRLLVHTGNVSVQLQPPGSAPPAAA